MKPTPKNSNSKYFLIADIHFSKTKEIIGFVNPMEEFITKFLADPFTGEKIIIIAGDYFDTLLSPQDEAAKLGAKYLKKLESISDKLIILYGTMSHDRENYDVLRPFLASSTIFIKKPEVINNILFIPENYPTDWQEFYAPWLGKRTNKYDMIIGHGMITGGSMGSIIIQDEVDNQRLGGKHFNPDTLSECADQVFFGHIHIGQEIRPNVRYIGSMNRLRFGDETPKGFWTSIIDKSTPKGPSDAVCEIEFTELLSCLKFDTVTLDKLDDYKQLNNIPDTPAQQIPTIDATDTPVPLSPRVRVVVKTDLDTEEIKKLKQSGFAIKNEATAKDARNAKQLSELKHGEIDADTPYIEAITKIMDADATASKKLKAKIKEELDKN